MNCGCSCLSPFRWQCEDRPSQFLTDPHFYRGAKSGMTVNAIQSAAIARATQKTGRSPGTLMGISLKADQMAESTHQRKGSYKRRAG